MVPGGKLVEEAEDEEAEEGEEEAGQEAEEGSPPSPGVAAGTNSRPVTSKRPRTAPAVQLRMNWARVGVGGMHVNRMSAVWCGMVLCGHHAQ